MNPIERAKPIQRAKPIHVPKRYASNRNKNSNYLEYWTVRLAPYRYCWYITLSELVFNVKHIRLKKKQILRRSRIYKINRNNARSQGRVLVIGHSAITKIRTLWTLIKKQFPLMQNPLNVLSVSRYG